MIKAILAIDDKFGIAKDGKIPWHNKEDFKFFHDKTIGNGNNAIVMGRKTAESIPSFPLKNRANRILSHTENGSLNITYDEIQELSCNYSDIFIIGGESVYNKAFSDGLVEEIYITKISGDYKCNQFINMEIIKENYKWDATISYSTFSVEIWIKK